jgi:energy-coupling factor transporter ATP-binding protein EcfA2
MTKSIEFDGITIPLPTESDNINTGFKFGIDITNPEHLKWKSDFISFEIMGGVNIKQLDRLRITLKISRSPLLTPLHTYRNTVDLYNDNQVERYVRMASEKLELGTNDVKIPVYTLIENLEKYRIEKRKDLLAPRHTPKVIITPKEKKEALRLLKNENLLPKISDLLKEIGLIGEENNGLLLFLIFLTRNFDYPLHAVVHGSSGSGKTNLLKTVINTVPDESKHITTALTENVLFYPPYPNFWTRKILMLEDLDGSLKALLPLREFMSNQEIVKFVTEMDTQSGEHKQKKLQAKGPICIVGATTKENIYEDNSNRSFLIHIDETKAQQRAVMNYQNSLAAGIINLGEIKLKQNILQNLQRLLLPLKIINPFQPELELPESIFKPLRTNQHYIQLIKAVTFLHQHQREQEKDEKGQPYITTTLTDIEWANKLSKDSLLRKSDELNGTQRHFFEVLKRTVKATDKTSFFAKEIRENYRIHPQTLKRHIAFLVDYGYIIQIGFAKRKYEYEIINWDDYTTLQIGLAILDDKLAELKQKYPNA